MCRVGLLWIALAGCNTGEMPAVDAPPDPGDGSGHPLGVFVPWNGNPTLPGPLSDKLGVTDATFQLEHLQIISDSATGDSRTTHTGFLLKWDMTGSPAQDVFPDAPEGVYSKVSIDMFGNIFDYSYEIHGTWMDGDQQKRFKIHDHAPLSLSIDCNKILSAAGSATIPIRVDLTDAITSVDYKSLDTDNGVSELDTTDSQMPAFRDKLTKAFKLDTTQQ
jgi:hypothetical protein